jgi:hypothetical protein
MFLKPSLSEVSVIYELPFDTSVWITYSVSVAILTAMLMFTRRVHERVNPFSSSDSAVGWSDSIMDSLAVVCQQGDCGHMFLFLRMYFHFYMQSVLEHMLLDVLFKTVLSPQNCEMRRR